MAKVALISGGNKGLGLETGRQLGALGYVVVLGSRDQARGEAAAAELCAAGVDARALQLDVADRAEIAAAADYLEREFGLLDVLVNNAGVMIAESWAKNTTSATTAETLRGTMETNFYGAVALTQAVLPLLMKSEGGRIVNVSSILGSLNLQAKPGSPVYGSKAFAYNTSKAALNSFTIHLAHELRRTKIKVNSAHPGWVKTDLGTSAAPMGVVQGAKTEVELATLGEDGPSGGFFHMGKAVEW